MATTSLRHFILVQGYTFEHNNIIVNSVAIRKAMHLIGSMLQLIQTQHVTVVDLISHQV